MTTQIPDAEMHTHAYADPVRIGVESTKIIGGDPTWTLIEEIFAYICACGDKIETRVPITINPVLELRYGRR